jgi:hypothetical protein
LLEVGFDNRSVLACAKIKVCLPHLFDTEAQGVLPEASLCVLIREGNNYFAAKSFKVVP